jgi:hypothetical protein
MHRHVSTLNVGHLQGTRKFFLACAAYGSTYITGILRTIKNIIIKITIVRPKHVDTVINKQKALCKKIYILNFTYAI